MNLSFRTKLLLCMMLVVLGVTTATIVLTQNRVRETYRQLFEEEFTSDLEFAADQQATRLATLRDQSDKLATNAAAIDALLKSDGRALFILLAQETGGPLRDFRPAQRLPGGFAPSTGGRGNGGQRGGQRGGGGGGLRGGQRGGEAPPPGNAQSPPAPGAPPVGGPGGPGGRGGPRGGPGEILPLFVGPDGRLIGTNNAAMGAARARVRKQGDLEPLLKSIPNLTNQEVAFLALEGTTNSPIREFLITPVFTLSDHKFAGAILLGTPLDLGERSLFTRREKVRSGILLDGEVYSQFMDHATATNVARLIAGDLLRSDQAESGPMLQVVVEGEPHHLVHRELNPGSPFGKAYQVGLFPMAAALKEVADLRNRIITSAAVTMFGAFLLSLLLTHGLSVPIHALVKATKAVRASDFSVRLPVRSHDEIGALTQSFNEMTEGLAEREKFRNMLNIVADPKVAEEMMRGGGANLGGELRKVTVLFCDIRGFTQLTSGMPPAEVIAMLNEHMTALTNVVHEQGGVVDKFVGDLIMAVFGAPRSTDKDAYNAARCAVRMIQERDALNQSTGRVIRIGIGMATGEVVAGCMGSSDRLNYTVLGERVNLASRLCGAAGAMEIIIDDSTRTELSDRARVEDMGTVTLKGFGEPVKASKLVEVRTFLV